MIVIDLIIKTDDKNKKKTKYIQRKGKDETKEEIRGK